VTLIAAVGIRGQREKGQSWKPSTVGYARALGKKGEMRVPEKEKAGKKLKAGVRSKIALRDERNDERSQREKSPLGATFQLAGNT